MTETELKALAASKEACQTALTDLRLLRSQLPADLQAAHQRKFDFLDRFLEVAGHRLPTAAAIARDKVRKRNARTRAQKRRRQAANDAHMAAVANSGLPPA